MLLWREVSLNLGTGEVVRGVELVGLVPNPPMPPGLARLPAAGPDTAGPLAEPGTRIGLSLFGPARAGERPALEWTIPAWSPLPESAAIELAPPGLIVAAGGPLDAAVTSVGVVVRADPSSSVYSRISGQTLAAAVLWQAALPLLAGLALAVPDPTPSASSSQLRAGHQLTTDRHGRARVTPLE